MPFAAICGQEEVKDALCFGLLHTIQFPVLSSLASMEYVLLFLPSSSGFYFTYLAEEVLPTCIHSHQGLSFGTFVCLKSGLP